MRIAMISAFGSRHDRFAPLASALAERGHRVHVYSMQRDGRLPAQLSISGGVMFERLPAARPPHERLLGQLGHFGRRLAQRWSDARTPPDVVHVESWPGCVTALAATQRPIVMTCRATALLGPEAAVTQAADRVITHCGQEAMALAYSGIPAHRVRVVPLGLDLGVFQPGSTAEKGGPLHRILAVGSMAQLDGVEDVIRSLPQLPEAELIVAGGPQRSRLPGDPVARRLRRLAAQMWVGERVRFLGSVASGRMPDLYRSAAVVACTRPAGSFSMVPLEAMACGVPVVGYQGGVAQDAVVDGRTGTLVRSGDLFGLTRALSEVLADGLLRLRQGNAARTQAQARYSWGSVAALVEQVYGEAIEEACMGPAMRVSNHDEAGIRG
jgi:glycosyltransferase involved in cell wall biosynthesis